MQLARPRRQRPRLSLIPLIDVMLVLLFFFMLVTTYVDVGRTRLELAAGSRAGAGGTAPAALVVLDGGRLRYGLETRPLAELLPQLQSLPAGAELRLSPAPGVSLQGLLAAWEQLQAAGIKAQLAGGP